LTVDAGANVLVGTGHELIRDGVKEQINQEKHWENTYGDGRASVSIVNSIFGTNEN
jgi:UDP-N-acetylglucosamine 2-epimerase